MFGRQVEGDASGLDPDNTREATQGEINRVQRIAVEESRLKIPLLIARDIIHGYRTVFPIPLGLAAGGAIVAHFVINALNLRFIVGVAPAGWLKLGVLPVLAWQIAGRFARYWVVAQGSL